MKMSIGFFERNGMLRLRKEPAPRISRIELMRNRAVVKPTPIPRPSTAEARTGFLLAKASALPRMMQLTTMSGR